MSSTLLPPSGSEIGRGFYVLRSQSDLIPLSHLLSCVSSARLLSHSGTASSPDQTTREAKPTSFQALIKEFQIDKILNEHANSLVGVVFEMLCCGITSTNDIITTPTLSHLKSLTDSQKPNSRAVIGHTVSSGLRITGSKHGGMGFCSLGGLISAAQVYHDFMMKEREKKREGERDDGILLLIGGKSLYYNVAKFDLFLN